MRETNVALWHEFKQELSLLLRCHLERYRHARYQLNPGSKILMPIDFPSSPYSRVAQQVSNYRGTHPELLEHHVAAWNALQYRYRACADHDAVFTGYVKKHGAVAHTSYALYVQQRELFGFCSTGLATIESFCYGLYAIGAIVDPHNFSMSTVKDLRLIDPSSTRDAFEKAFSGEKITDTLKDKLESSDYKDLHKLRNILVHRVTPARIIFMGGDRDGEVEWQKAVAKSDVPIPGGGTKIDWDSLLLNKTTTSSRRAWLAGTLHHLLDDAKGFALSRL